MADYCTCGAQLPPDALFCHKCGKPQREIIAPEIEPNTYATAATAPVADAPPPPRPQPLPLNFHNPTAVRIALVAAVGATMLGALVPRFPFVSWLAAGFIAVYLYCRKTGFHLDVQAGVKIGWITGLILYGFSAVVFTAQQLPDALSGHPGKTILEEMKKSTFQDPAMLQQLTNTIQSAPGMFILLLLAVLFVMVTCLSMAGGALGAKLVGSPK